MKNIHVRISDELKKLVDKRLKNDSLTMNTLVVMLLRDYSRGYINIFESVQSEKAKKAPSKLSDEETKIYELVKHGPQYFDDICIATGMERQKVRRLTFNLEIKKLIKNDGGVLSPCIQANF